MKVDWSASNVKLAVSGIPLLKGLCQIGTGNRALVFAGPTDEHAFKLTCDPLAYRFLQELHTAPEHHLPRVYKDWGKVGELPSGEPLYLVQLERLHLRKGERTLAIQLRKIWLKALFQQPKILAIPVQGIGAFEGLPLLANALLAIERFTQQTGACFDGDTSSNILFRSDGTPVLADPVLSL